LKRYIGAVDHSAPEGYRIVAAPSAGGATVETVAGPVKIVVIGFVDAEGRRYYLEGETYRRWIETGDAPVWIVTGGTEQLPALPRLLATVPTEDPDTGDATTVQVYEETSVVLPESRWPIARPVAKAPRKRFPAAVVSAEPGAVDFQLFANPDAPCTGYPLAEPSFRERQEGKAGPLFRLVSRADRALFRLVSDRAFPEGLFTAGLVWVAEFEEGRLVELSTGGDAGLFGDGGREYFGASEPLPVSHFGAPGFHRGETLEFAFPATLLPGGEAVLRVRPDRIVGADYTRYDLIAKMGPPFDEDRTAEIQRLWFVRLSGDLKVEVVAPLWDGRGAPGMLELEGLSLEVAPAASAIYSEEQFAAFSKKEISSELDPARLGEGWRSLLAEPLGEIPAAQRGPETEGF
jgi:hypothetical protein